MIVAALLAAGFALAPLRHLTYDGRDRTYRVFRPANLSRERAVPLLVMLHGGFGTGRQAERAYGWDEAATRHGFVVVYPDGIARAWNAGSCCGKPSRENVDDVGYLTTLIHALASTEHIDESHVVVAGMSNGAMMAYRMACDAPIHLYGIASVAGTMMTPCRNAKPTNVLEIHGDADRNVPYAGGRGEGPAHVDALPVADVVNRWRSIDGCDPACASGYQVTLITVRGGAHQWPRGNGLEATDTIVHAMQLASP